MPTCERSKQERDQGPQTRQAAGAASSGGPDGLVTALTATSHLFVGDGALRVGHGAARCLEVAATAGGCEGLAVRVGTAGGRHLVQLTLHPTVGNRLALHSSETCPHTSACYKRESLGLTLWPPSCSHFRLKNVDYSYGYPPCLSHVRNQ